MFVGVCCCRWRSPSPIRTSKSCEARGPEVKTVANVLDCSKKMIAQSYRPADGDSQWKWFIIAW